MQAKKIRVPGKLIELLRSDIPISEKRKYLDQLSIRYLYYKLPTKNCSNKCIRLKLNDAYDYPTLNIIKEGVKPDEIFAINGKIYTLHMLEYNYSSTYRTNGSWPA